MAKVSELAETTTVNPDDLLLVVINPATAPASRKIKVSNLVVSTMLTGTAGGDLSGSYPNPSVVNDSHSHSPSTLIGLGNAATRDVGTTAGTVAAGDDSRFSPPAGASGTLQYNAGGAFGGVGNTSFNNSLSLLAFSSGLNFSISGRFSVMGGLAIKHIVSSGNYTITSLDSIIGMYTTSAPRTATLPVGATAAASFIGGGQPVYIIVDEGNNASVNNITIACAGSDTFVGGATSVVLDISGGSITVYWTGSAWQVVRPYIGPAGSSAAGLVSTGAQTFAGVKTFADLLKMQQATVNDGAWAGTGATALLFQGADSSSGSPSTSLLPSVSLQTTRSGGTAGTGIITYGFGFTNTGKSDMYGPFGMGRYTANMTGYAAGAYNQHGGRDYMIGSPTNIPGGANVHIYGRWIQGERTVSGIRVVGAQIDSNNNVASDANVSTASIDSCFNLATNYTGLAHSTGIIYSQGAKEVSAYVGWYPDADSICQRILDFSPTIATLQGTWTATNGSPTVSGSGGHADVEAVGGDWLKINGTYARVFSATANSITLASAFTGTTGSGLTITKATQAMWLANNQPIAALNAAGSARPEFVRFTEGNRWKIDEDAQGVQLGGFLAFSRSVVNVANGLNSNIDIGSGGFVRQGGATGAFSLGGFTGGIDGRVLYWFNTNGQTMTIVNEDGASTAANRIATKTGGNVVLAASSQSSAIFIYSGADSRWILMSTN